MPDPLNAEDLDLGYIREGVVEIDPISGRMVIRTTTTEGYDYLDVQETLTKYAGQDVRIVIVPCSTIHKVADMVESVSLPLDQVPRTQRS
jgi:aspartate/glutamate racemase